MATKHTEHYQLNLWEPEDSFLRTEFNENSAKIDAALAALNAAGLKFTTGSYGGTGELTKTLTFPFQPRLVVICGSNRGISDDITVLIRGQGYGCKGSIRPALTWSGNSVTLTVNDASNVTGVFNHSGGTYYYAALG